MTADRGAGTTRSADGGLPRWTPRKGITPEQTARLNALASAIAKAAGEDGWLPLSVRYCAAADALAVIEQWEQWENGDA